MRIVESSDVVDVIIRFHDCALLSDLDRALFSLFQQSYRHVRPIVVNQGLNHSDFDRVNDAVAEYDWAYRGVSPIVHNVDNPENRDIRSRLLNVGMSLGTGRYLAFLDCDDYMYRHAYEWLIESLGSTGAGIAFGGIAAKYVQQLPSYQYAISKDLGQYCHPTRTWDDLVVDNFCPIHSFVIDKTVVSSDYLEFNEDIARLEDYAFLLEICSRYPAVFSSMEKHIGAYIWKSNGTNSSIIGNEDESLLVEKSVAWDFAKGHISSIKRRIMSRVDQES